MNHNFQRFLPLYLILTSLILSGCGDRQGVVIEGQLLYNGQPYKLGKDEELQILFEPAEEGAASVTSPVDVNSEDGTIRVAGPKNKGIPPGKYRITVLSNIYGESKDKFSGAFQGDKTPLTYEATAERNQKITIDLGKKTVARQ